MVCPLKKLPKTIFYNDHSVAISCDLNHSVQEGEPRPSSLKKLNRIGTLSLMVPRLPSLKKHELLSSAPYTLGMVVHACNLALHVQASDQKFKSSPATLGV